MPHDDCVRCCFYVVCSECSSGEPCDDFAPTEENDDDIGLYISARAEEFKHDWNRYFKLV